MDQVPLSEGWEDRVQLKVGATGERPHESSPQAPADHPNHEVLLHACSIGHLGILIAACLLKEQVPDRGGSQVSP